MQLQYLWIKEYKNIKEQGFNFSSKFLFNYDPTTGKLDIQENEKHIPDFYGETISELSAIVGENGTGKTNVIDFICREVIYNQLSTSIVFVIAQNIYYTEELKCKVIDYYKKIRLGEHGFIIHKFSKKPFIRPDPNTWEVQALDTPIIYYSNFIRKQLNPIFKNDRQHYDISTAYLLQNEKKNYFRDKSYLKLSYKGIYFNEESRKQIEYVCFNQNELFPFIPKTASINFNNYDITALGDWEKYKEDARRSKIKSFDEFDLEKSAHEILLSKINEWDFEFSSFDDFSDKFYRAVFLNVLRHYIGVRDVYLDFDDAAKAIDIGKSNGKYILEDYLKKQQQIHYETEHAHDIRKKNIKYNTKLFKSISDFLEAIKEGIQDGVVVFTEGEVIITLDRGGKQLFKLLFQSYEKLTTEYGFLNFSWRGLSTGETAFLSLTSRLFDASRNIYRESLNQNELLLLLDEGESHFHPQWQKEFFSNLKSVLETLFPDKKIQIILTSHSPFIISDFTLSNIIFLKKSNDGNCIVHKNPLEDKKATFASNIHTLFTDSFFLKGGLIGDFAKEKINQLIDKLIGQSQFSEADHVYFKKIIAEIGEPLIRRRLMQLYEDKLKLNIADEFAVLRNRVTKLEQKNNDSNKKEES
jgi:hypothetical protein